MPIDIVGLTEQELVELNHQIMARIKLLRELNATAHMLDFRIGQRVSFQPAGRPRVYGVIARYNRKTVTVIADCGHRWNCSPGLLQPEGEILPKAAEELHEIDWSREG